MPTLIAIDQGTTSTRTVAFDTDLNIIHSKQKEYPLIYPNDGWVEIEPEELMNSVIQQLILFLMLAPMSLLLGLLINARQPWYGIQILESLFITQLFGKIEGQ